MIAAMTPDAVTPPAHPLFEQPWPEGEFRFFQLGHVVDDVFAAAASWVRAFGIGPFHVLPVVEQRANYGDEIRAVKIQVAVAQAGPVQIELIQQHCDTPSIFQDWSRGGASAFHQIATVTNDYDGKKGHFEALGYEIAAESLAGKFRVAYVEHRFGLRVLHRSGRKHLRLSRAVARHLGLLRPAGTASTPSGS